MDRTTDRQPSNDDKRPRDEHAEWMARLDRALDQLRGPQRTESGTSR